MLRKVIMYSLFLVSIGTTALAADKTQAPEKLSAPEIAEKNAAARGGLQKWRSVQTMRVTGKMEAGGNTRPTLQMPGRKDKQSMPPPRAAEQVRLPFVMELKRPRKMRVEVTFAGQNAVQVFDGAEGWKLRPYLNRREVEPYTVDEMKLAVTQSELDGPLMDYAAKQTSIELAGIDKVEGHDAYKLKLSMKNGVVKNLWIDTTSFLELKMEGDPRKLDGRPRPVEIYFRDYRMVNGLGIPFVMETKVLASNAPGKANVTTATEQMILEKVEVNTALNDGLFTKADLVAAAANKPVIGKISQTTTH